MIFFIISFLAGVLTVLTPCVLPILPIVLGGTASVVEDKKKPFIIVASLGASVFIFTLLLKVSSAFINVPESFWQYLSAFVILVFGLSLVFPGAWAEFSHKIPGFNKSNDMLNQSYKNRSSWWGPIAIGASLGPVFTTCSPTFFVILATVLPSSTFLGIIYLLAYDLGLSIFLLLIAFVGQKFLLKVSALSDPQSKLMRGLGVFFVFLAIAIGTGFEKRVEANLLSNGYFDFTKLEMRLKDYLTSAEPVQNNPSLVVATTTSDTKIQADKTSFDNTTLKQLTDNYKPYKYSEIKNPSGFVNSEPFQLKDLIGKKVILVDFMTYSCINCQRTFPYLNSWYDKYKSEGLEIVAIHTPEFSFERNIDNVKKAAGEFKLKFPLVLDNDYGTWNAYGNQYWPRKYIIDINGNVIYDHIGEGDYQSLEKILVELLKQRADKLGMADSDVKVKSGDNISPTGIYAYSPETYFGAFRNSNFGNGNQGETGVTDFKIPDLTISNKFYLGGKWDVETEKTTTVDSSAKLLFKFNAKEVYIVAESAVESEADVLVDGVKTQTIKIKDSKLYHVVSLPTPGAHTLEIIFKSPNTSIYAFTFG